MLTLLDLPCPSRSTTLLQSGDTALRPTLSATAVPAWSSPSTPSNPVQTTLLPSSLSQKRLSPTRPVARRLLVEPPRPAVLRLVLVRTELCLR
ncbi:hypothetical protein C8R42DRAFT_407989 [Lentinula raphanica]|nr:hypothetical protein C8R42DRAFT_407989 [Lentinula raphanica]